MWNKACWLIAALASFSAIPVAAADSEFLRQCKLLLPRADDFYAKCQRQGVPFGQTFYPSGGTRGEREGYRVLFSNDYANSHFVLGCVLVEGSPNRMVNLYYKTSTEPLPPLTEDQIQYADVDGNVGLKTNGRRHILLALRQIVTDTIPERNNGQARNCETSDMTNMPLTAISPVLKRGPSANSPVSFCSNPDVPCYVDPYLTFFGGDMSDTIFMPDWKLFVDGNGALLVEKPYQEAACATWLDVYGPSAIVLETCATPPIHP